MIIMHVSMSNNRRCLQYIIQVIHIHKLYAYFMLFKNYRMSVDCDPRSGRPLSTLTPENIDRSCVTCD